MKENRRIKRLAKQGSVSVARDVDQHVFREICSLAGVESINNILDTQPFWRSLMHNRIAQAVTLSVLLLVALTVLFLPWSSESKLSAAEILKEAVAKIPAEIKTARIEGKVRSSAADNFSGLAIDANFTPTTLLWKQNDQGTKWRIDKGTTKRGRTVSMDGQETLLCLYISEGEGMAMKCPPFPEIGPFDTGWYRQLIDPKKLLENEYENTLKDQAGEENVTQDKEKIDGKEVLIVKVHYKANVPEGDYLRNAFIEESDHTNAYFFDAETKDLLKMQIIVHVPQKEVVVFETTKISYGQPIDDTAFELTIPEGIEIKSLNDMRPKAIPNNEKYEAMSPKEAATAFFQACHDENWKEVEIFLPAVPLTSQFKEGLGGVEIIEIGEPFQSELFAKHKMDAWFVPYHIRFKNGQENKHNLALKKDPQVKRYFVDGGI